MDSAQLTNGLTEEPLDAILALGFIVFSGHVILLHFDNDYAAWFLPMGKAALLLQARQDLNPQPLVLETRALPIEPLAYACQAQYLRPDAVTSFRDAKCASGSVDNTC